MRSKNKVYAPTGRAYTAYICTRKENKGRGECDSHMIKCSVIDEAVIEKLKEISVNKESLVAFAYKDTPKPIYNVKQLEKRLKTLTTEIKSLTTALVDAKNSTARKYIIEEIENKDEEKASINAKLTEAKVIDLQEVKNNAYLDKVYDNIQMLLNNFDNLDDEAKNQLIKSIVKEIVVSDESISITI